jgi:hypothetical protein
MKQRDHVEKNNCHAEIVMIEGFISLTLFRTENCQNRKQSYLKIVSLRPAKTVRFMKPLIMTILS